MQYEIIVVGGGIAGLSAAMFASRQGVNTLVISQDLGGTT
jgi:NAD/FAD-utilizing enzyme apparently involved in cell division